MCWRLCSLKCFAFLSTPQSKTNVQEKKHGGWKTMPYIIGNETFEKLASYGLQANFMVYLIEQFNMEQVMAANVVTIWSGTSNFTPVIGAFLSDAYFGRFRTVAFASITSFLAVTYCTSTTGVMVAITIIVYIQGSIGWAIGLGILTLLMLCSILIFLVGTRLYVYIEPWGSVFTGFCQVFVAAFKKRKLTLPSNPQQVLYDPPTNKAPPISSKLPLTDHLSCLNKAAIHEVGEVKPDGSPVNPWKLCGIQQIEEVKCLIRTIPVWAAGVICFTALVQQGTFTVIQAMKMDRHLGPHFQIPPGALIVIFLLALSIWIPIYDRIVVPNLQKITKQEGGITLLQRMGIGLVISVMLMMVAGFVEGKRRNSVVSRGGFNGIEPISVLWLAPQLALMGLAEAFNAVGQIEFCYKQFPDHMRSVAVSLFSLTMAGASYLSSFMVTLVHKTTGKHGQPKWLGDDINTSRLDYFYYLIAGLGVLNLFYFLICASCYHYKASSQVGDVEESNDVIEMDPKEEQ